MWNANSGGWLKALQQPVDGRYGADGHSTTNGSGFPTIERHPAIRRYPPPGILIFINTIRVPVRL